MRWSMRRMTRGAGLGLLLFAGLPCAQAASFAQTHAVVFGAPPAARDAVEQREMAVYAQGQLPEYEVSASNFFAQGVNLLKRDAQRTLVNQQDYFDRLPKLLHSNGICFSGLWQIDQANPYSGSFRHGTKALFIGRASVSLSETRREQPRGLAFAGKVFPTLDRNQQVRTANFFVADVLSGVQRDHYLSNGMTNKPSVGFRWATLPMMFQVARAFAGVDSKAGYRPVDNIAAQGGATVVRAPQFLMIRPSAHNPRNQQADFRDELNLTKNGVSGWDFDILVSDTVSQPEELGWQKIGVIHANDSIVSYGCDRRLHFAHPKVDR